MVIMHGMLSTDGHFRWCGAHPPGHVPIYQCDFYNDELCAEVWALQDAWKQALNDPTWCAAQVEQGRIALIERLWLITGYERTTQRVNLTMRVRVRLYLGPPAYLESPGWIARAQILTQKRDELLASLSSQVREMRKALMVELCRRNVVIYLQPLTGEMLAQALTDVGWSQAELSPMSGEDAVEGLLDHLYGLLPWKDRSA